MYSKNHHRSTNIVITPWDLFRIQLNIWDGATHKKSPQLKVNDICTKSNARHMTWLWHGCSNRKQEKHKKNHEILAFKSLLQEIRLTWPSERFSEALTSKLWNKKEYMLPKLTEMERSWIMFIPLWFYEKSLTAPSKI